MNNLILIKDIPKKYGTTISTVYKHINHKKLNPIKKKDGLYVSIEEVERVFKKKSGKEYNEYNKENNNVKKSK